MRKFIQQFVADESGATAIEYGLLASLIAMVIMLAVYNIGNRLNSVFTRVALCLTTPSAANCAPA